MMKKKAKAVQEHEAHYDPRLVFREDTERGRL